MASTTSTTAAGTPLAACLALFLRKAVPEAAEPPYLGPVTAIAALEGGPDDVDVKRDGAKLMAAIAQSRRFRMQLVDRGAVELVCEQLSATSDKQTRLYAMQTLAHLGLDPKAHRRLHSSGAVDALLAHLARPVCDREESEEALRALHCLLTSPAIRERFVALDGIARMADLVVSGSALQKERAAFVLWMLAAIPGIQPTFVATKAIPALVHALQDAASSDLTDVALSALTLLAEDEACRNALLAERVLELLPRIAQSDARDEVTYRTELLEEMLTARPQRV